MATSQREPVAQSEQEAAEDSADSGSLNPSGSADHDVNFLHTESSEEADKAETSAHEAEIDAEFSEGTNNNLEELCEDEDFKIEINEDSVTEDDNDDTDDDGAQEQPSNSEDSSDDRTSHNNAELDTNDSQKEGNVTEEAEPQWYCPICGCSFSAEAQMSAHIAEHVTHTLGENHSLHICDTCYIVLPDKESLATHREQTHVGKDTHVCTLCYVMFDDVLRLREHLMETHVFHPKVDPDGSSQSAGQGLACKQCGQIFSSDKTLKAHACQHSSSTELAPHEVKIKQESVPETDEKISQKYEVYYCRHCTKLFNQEEDFLKHVATQHPVDAGVQQVKKKKRKRSEKRVQCKLCGKMLAHRSSWKEHMIVHSGVRAYSCDKCGKKFRQKSTLTKHEVVHTKVRRYQCGICNKRYTQSASLREHLLIHQGVKSYSCEQCGAAFLHAYQLRRHELNHSEAAELVCAVCGKTCRGQKKLDKHMAAEHNETGPEHRCRKCDAVFPTDSQLRRHRKEKHGSQKDGLPPGTAKYSCQWCEEQFSLKNELDRHVRIVHTDVRPFLCTQCPWQFKDNNCLQRHLSTVHGERRFKCHKCDKSFTGKLNLNSHLVSHSTARPHQCIHCGSFFKRTSTLNAHVQALHTGRRYHCPICQKEFTQKTHIRNHMMRIHTHEKPIQCPYCPKRFTTRWDVKNHAGKMHKDKIPDDDPYFVYSLL